MSVISAERFAGGLTWKEYLAQCEEHLDQRRKLYASVTFTAEQEAALSKLKNLGLHALIIEEDWCGDAARTGPVLARIAEATGIKARWFLRDSNLDIMDQYLEGGTSRAIPVFVFMDKDLNYLSHWGSRPAAVKKAIKPLLPLPPREDPAREEAFERFREVLTDAYNSIFPEGIVNELLEHITKAAG